jgi:hypothetical protein
VNLKGDVCLKTDLKPNQLLLTLGLDG